MNLRRRMLDHLDDDIRDHIERETRENIERGMTPDEARFAALRKFGNVTRVMEQTREVWSRVWLEQLLQDIRYGFRMLRRNRGFTFVVVLTLALGIGMNTAVFSVVNSVLLRPLVYPHPQQLAWIGEYDPNIKRDIVSSPHFYDWRRQAQSFTAMAAYGYQQATIAGSHDARQVSGICVAGDFWTITGAQPALGRLFGPEAQGAVVLSWDLFERQFAGDPAVVGKSVSVEGSPYTVSGVLPKSFRFQFPMWWLASQPQPVEAYFPLPNQDVQRRRNVNVVAALKPGVGTGQALAELEVMEKHIRQASDGPQRPVPLKLRVEPLQEKLVAGTRPALFILLAAGTFVLLMAAVNVANLLLARATVRQREIAIRAAIGAGRARVVRQLLAESVVLALLGGAVGLAFARWAIEILVRLSPHALPRLAETTLDGRVLAFTAAVSVATGVLFGTGPAISLWRANLHDALKSGARTSAGLPGLRIRRMLVAGELALAVVLLTGAGLMLKSLRRMNAHPPELAPERVLVMKVRLSGAQYAAAASDEAYMRELVRRIESAPGVQAAGISNWLLFEGLLFPGQTSPDQAQVIRLNGVSPGYLRAMGMRLVKGRWLTGNEPAGAVLLNQSMARQLFGDADPLGRRFNIPGQEVGVAGVVADLKYSKLDAAPPAEAFLPYHRIPMLRGTDVAVRTTGDPEAMAPAIRKLISGIDPTQPVYDVKTLEQALAESVAPRRFNLILLETFAAAALLLALVGVYGVMAYSVGERTREIGLRMALGAQARQVVRMVVREGATIALAGIAAGLAAAFLLTRLMASLLYDVTPTDPPTFAAATIVLAVAALAACWAPALKAASVDPMDALRSE